MLKHQSVGTAVTTDSYHKIQRCQLDKELPLIKKTSLLATFRAFMTTLNFPMCDKSSYQVGEAMLMYLKDYTWHVALQIHYLKFVPHDHQEKKCKQIVWL